MVGARLTTLERSIGVRPITLGRDMQRSAFARPLYLFAIGRTALAVSALACISVATPAFADKVGDQFRVNTTAGGQGRPSAARLSGGGFVVVWNGYGDGGYGIDGRRFDSTGRPFGKKQFLVSNDGNITGKPAVAGLSGSVSGSDGGFVVTWISDRGDGNGSDVYRRLYDSAGNRVGGALRANTYTEGQQGQIMNR